MKKANNSGAGVARSAGEAERGWDSTFREFNDSKSSQIISALRKFMVESTNSPGVSGSQERAWKDSIRCMQRELREVGEVCVGSESYGIVLEYTLPLEFRRPDSLLLLNRSVVVVEFKGDLGPTQASVDQTHAYARDLRAYHRECHHREVHPVLVPMGMKGVPRMERGVTVCSPKHLDQLILDLDKRSAGEPIDRQAFLDDGAYRPLPSLVVAARELLINHRPPRLWQSVANTDEATETLRSIARHAKATGTRRLALLTGVPGAGKTLVGLRLAHEPELDALTDAAASVPAVFLSGNGPLVSVLQYELKEAGGGGQTFVRAVDAYVKRYATRPDAVPDEHVVVFDEAQRAWDIHRVEARHQGAFPARTEPAHLVEFAERRKDWAVIVGLVGHGQEIHVGEEGGLKLWGDALKENSESGSWIVHGPPEMREYFKGTGVEFRSEVQLNLTESIRSHRSEVLHDFVDALLDLESGALARELLKDIENNGFDFKVSRDRPASELYLRQRYSEYPSARYGKLVSGRAKDMGDYGFPNDWGSVRTVKNKVGAWYGNDEGEAWSCRNLCTCATEFIAQGLELDAALVCWGPDLRLVNQAWDNSRMTKYRGADAQQVRDPLQLRLNAYRVLLTRARDACIVFVPEIVEDGKDIMEDLYRFLCDCGLRELKKENA